MQSLFAFLGGLCFGLVAAQVWTRAKGTVLRASIVRWLRANPGWHYGIDICAGSKVPRGAVYQVLGDLEYEGVVQRMVGAKTNPGLPRPLYSLRVG